MFYDTIYTALYTLFSLANEFIQRWRLKRIIMLKILMKIANQKYSENTLKPHLT